MKAKNYTRSEERLNYYTHLAGAILSLAGLIYFLFIGRNHMDSIPFISVMIFCAALIVMYSFSAAYHYVEDENNKKFFRKLDHSAIFVLIAGSYTPLMSILLSHKSGMVMIILAWSMAIIGLLIELFPIFKSRIWSIALYLVMGWMALIVIKPIYVHASAAALSLIIVGGLFYTSGVFFYVKKTLYHNHGIWHFFVLAGSLCHYFAILNIFQASIRALN